MPTSGTRPLAKPQGDGGRCPPYGMVGDAWVPEMGFCLGGLLVSDQDEELFWLAGLSWEGDRVWEVKPSHLAAGSFPLAVGLGCSISS